MIEEIQQAIIEDIRRVALEMRTEELSRSEYLLHGKFTAYQIYDDGKNWSILCQQAGIKSKTKKKVSDETYFCNLTSAVETLGRYPLATERKKFGLNFSKRRFPNLSVFIDRAVILGYVPDLRLRKKDDEVAPDSVSSAPVIIDIMKKYLQKSDESPRFAPPIPLSTKRTKWERTGLPGFPYAPQEEQGVLALFAILCVQGVLPWQILDISAGKGIDVTCYDETCQKEIRVELKYLLSKGNWNHPLDDLDYVVCWVSHWPDFPKPVLELSKILRKLWKSDQAKCVN